MSFVNGCNSGERGFFPPQPQMFLDRSFSHLGPFGMAGPSFLVRGHSFFHGLPRNIPFLVQGRCRRHEYKLFRTVPALTEDASVASLESGADSNYVLAEGSLFQSSSSLFFSCTRRLLVVGFSGSLMPCRPGNRPLLMQSSPKARTCLIQAQGASPFCRIPFFY